MRLLINLFVIALAFVMNSCKKEEKIIDGWELVWSDEFDGKNIDLSNWTFDIGTGAPIFKAYAPSSPVFVPKDFPDNNFSINWSGKINPDHSCKYTLFVVADDGMSLMIDNEIKIDAWKPQPATEYSTKLILEKKPYNINIEYFEESGGETAILGWECKHIKKSVIKSRYLKTNGGEPGLTGEYFSGKNFENSKLHAGFSRTDSTINWITGGSGWGNRELQYYTDSNKNIRTINGKMVIEAKKEYHLGSDYTSARIKTKESWRYGRFEIKAKLPKGVGTWAAFWGLPTEWKHGPWPNSGEIDILEHVGFEEGHVVSSLHNIAHHGDLSKSDQTKYVVVDSVVSSFNNYILEWDKNKINTYINDKLIFSYLKNGQPWERWPFDEKFHFILNVAVGGNWGGKEGVDDKALPSKMEIDYFRVYKKKS